MLTELRGKEILPSILFFGFLIIIIFNFSFDIGINRSNDIWAGILWVAFIFSGILGLNRSFSIERENDSLYGLMLSPIDRGGIYLAKLIGNIIFMITMESVIIPIFSILFNLRILNILPELLIIILLGTIGFSSVGTLFAAMVTNTKMKEIMLPIILFPIILPIIIASVKSTSEIMDGERLSNISSWLKLMIGFDIIFIGISFLVFEYVIEE
jgi:heme exporter protein B